MVRAEGHRHGVIALRVAMTAVGRRLGYVAEDGPTEGKDALPVDNQWRLVGCDDVRARQGDKQPATDRQRLADRAKE